MSSSSNRTFGEIVNTWAQTCGIIGAGLWGYYIFSHTENTVKSAPVNISINLQLKKIGRKDTVAEKQGLIAVEMQAEASNPSIRDVFLLRSVWIAFGCNVGTGADDASFMAKAKDSLNTYDEVFAERFAMQPPCTNFADGHIFKDTVLRPKESTRRTVIFYVPFDKYDAIKVHVRMPTTDKSKGVVLEWKPIDDTHDLEFILYHVAGNGDLTEFKKDNQGAYLVQDEEEFGLEEASSWTELSLWQ
jgi:hypothetical protein